MTKHYKGPWNAAAWRSKTQRTYKTCGPVGEHPVERLTKARWVASDGGGAILSACVWCGYHVCSCEPACVKPCPTKGCTLPASHAIECDAPKPTLMFEGRPLVAGDILVDRDPPNQPPRSVWLAARIFRVTEVDGDSVDMVLLNRSDGTLWPSPEPCTWSIADIREELKRRERRGKHLEATATGPSADNPDQVTYHIMGRQGHKSHQSVEPQLNLAKNQQARRTVSQETGGYDVLIFDGRPLKPGDLLFAKIGNPFLNRPGNACEVVEVGAHVRCRWLSGNIFAVSLDELDLGWERP